MKCKGRIEYTEKDTITEDDFDPKRGKFRVTMYINLAVLDNIRRVAKERGMPYQTLINQTLMDHFGQAEKQPTPIELIEKLFEEHSEAVNDKIDKLKEEVRALKRKA